MPSIFWSSERTGALVEPFACRSRSPARAVAPRRAPPGAHDDEPPRLHQADRRGRWAAARIRSSTSAGTSSGRNLRMSRRAPITSYTAARASSSKRQPRDRRRAAQRGWDRIRPGSAGRGVLGARAWRRTVAARQPAGVRRRSPIRSPPSDSATRGTRCKPGRSRATVSGSELQMATATAAGRRSKPRSGVRTRSPTHSRRDARSRGRPPQAHSLLVSLTLRDQLLAAATLPS